ncbi:hypothetical protein [Halobellus ruber]|uniref:Uncharacterized protein n=1 Tax=Halobellus ruber TaxID=2761102 RepID=A0A7J9SK33_9EURY|nr:hypothetical protein [Halobellus ruber]MBB6646743.1 hypothetical protein [Halobellus ruber]
MAAVVVSDGVTPERLEDHCPDRGTLTNFNRPRSHVVAGGSLPRTDTGTLIHGGSRTWYFDD